MSEFFMINVFLMDYGRPPATHLPARGVAPLWHQLVAVPPFEQSLALARVPVPHVPA